MFGRWAARPLTSRRQPLGRPATNFTPLAAGLPAANFTPLGRQLHTSACCQQKRHYKKKSCITPIECTIYYIKAGKVIFST
jgi:hypothetical protein